MMTIFKSEGIFKDIYMIMKMKDILRISTKMQNLTKF